MEETNTSTESVEGTTDAQPIEDQVTAPETDNAQPEAQETETTEDSFFDPTSIPDELKPAYKQMQAAFTKKTQEIAQAKKEAEAIRAKAEAYDKVQQHIPIVEEMLASRQQQTANPALEQLKQQYRAQGYTEDAIEMITSGLDFALKHINQTQAVERETARVSSQIEEAGKLDPRLNDTSLVYQTADGEKFTYGQMVEDYVAADQKWRQDPVAATKRAMSKVDALIGKAKTDGKEELSQAAKSKAQKFPTTSSSPQSTTSANESLSFRDAAKEASKETGISLKS